jgi:hypothetical protein
LPVAHDNLVLVTIKADHKVALDRFEFGSVLQAQAREGCVGQNGREEEVILVCGGKASAWVIIQNGAKKVRIVIHDLGPLEPRVPVDIAERWEPSEGSGHSVRRGPRKEDGQAPRLVRTRSRLCVGRG